MQGQSNEISCYEEDRVGAGLQARIAFSVRNNDSSEAEIYCGGEEGRAKRDAVYVYDKKVPAEVVVVDHDAGNVGGCFQCQAHNHADQDAPGAVIQTNRKVDEK